MLKNCTLLYVEDNKDMQQYMKIFLEDKLKKLIIAEDGIDGLKCYVEHQPDIVLCDINMPNLDGLKMSKKIKEINKNQPIIILTALSYVDGLKDAINMGINAFINKPLHDVNILLNKLEEESEKVYYTKNSQLLEKVKNDEEKIELLLKMINNISHHWRQPLSVISTTSSAFSFYKKNNFLEVDRSQYIKMADKISEKVEELSAVLNKLESLNNKDLTVEKIEEIINISNPLYGNSI